MYIGPHGVAALHRHKYSGVDHSYVAKYVLQPFWTWFVTLFPLWMPWVLLSFQTYVFVFCHKHITYLFYKQTYINDNFILSLLCIFILIRSLPVFLMNTTKLDVALKYREGFEGMKRGGVNFLILNQELYKVIKVIKD